MSRLLDGLDRAQRTAVTHGEGPLLVLAGPGTGKTEVLTRRVAWLIATKRARPSEVLALTFTDRAAEEMQARVDLLVPYGQADTAIHTFHAFGDRLLREYGFELGLPADPRVIGRGDAIVLLREHLFELGLDRFLPAADPTRFLGDLVDRFGRAKDLGLRPSDLAARAETFASIAGVAAEAAANEVERTHATSLQEEADAERELAHAYGVYERLLRDRGLVDFGDQVADAVRLLEERPAVRAELHRRFRYVVVDEAQDTNAAQARLLTLLAGPRRNLTLVGDDDQAIYTFRGASTRDLLSFTERFPDARRVVLRRNHRSRAPILATAYRLIRHNDPDRLEVREGLDKRLVAVRRSRRPAPVRCATYDTPDEEAEAIAAAIIARVQGGATYAQHAVLVRTHADAVPVLRALAHRGVPVRASGGGSALLARAEVRELLAFLRAVVAPHDSVALYAVLTGRPYGLGGSDLTEILDLARRRGRSLWWALLELEAQPRLLRLSAATQRTVTRARDDLRAAIEASHRRPVGEVLYDHLGRSGRLRDLVAAAERGDDAPLRNVARLFDLVRARATMLREDRLPFLVPYLDALADAGDDTEAEDGLGPEDAVAVLTIHRAKGLEFGVVFVPGMADARFPLRSRAGRLPPLSLDPVADRADAALAEERRLCYVAMTRARDELHLSWSRRSSSGRVRRPSPFLAEALDAPLDLDAPAAATDVAGLIGARLVASVGTMEPAPPAAARAAPIQGPLSLSYSQIDDYLTCPQKHRLRHVLRVPTPAHHSLVTGNALHQAIAAFGLARKRGRVMDEAELVSVLDSHWVSEGFLSRAHEEARYGAARAAVLRYRDEELTSGAAPPEAIERSFSVAIDGDVIRGRYDRVDLGPHGAVITDLKSSDVRDRARADARARDSLQLQVYALAHEAETGQLPAELRLHFLESGQVGAVRPDPKRLEKARERIRTAAVGIRAGDQVARPDVIACGFCPYRRICPSAAA